MFATRALQECDLCRGFDRIRRVIKTWRVEEGSVGLRFANPIYEIAKERIKLPGLQTASSQTHYGRWC